MLILCNVLSVKVEAQGRFHKTVSTDRNGDGSMYGAMVGTSDGGFVLACNKQGKSGGITNIFLAKLDASSNIVWNRSIGGPYVEFATSLMKTTDGGFIITGFTFTTSQQVYDVLLVKTDSLGNPLWSKTFGGTTMEEGRSVRQTSDGGYIVTAFKYTPSMDSGDAYLIKTDANGDLEWTKTFNGIAEVASIRQLPDGGFILACDKYIAKYRHEICLLRTDNTGNIQWTKQFDGVGVDHVAAMLVVNDGLILAGHKSEQFPNKGGPVGMKLDLNGNVIWAKKYISIYDNNISSVWKTTDSGFVFSGGGDNMLLIKTDASGNLLWVNTIGQDFMVSENAFAVVQTADGGFLVSGSKGLDSVKIFLVKTDALGNSGCLDTMITHTAVDFMPNVLTPSFTIGTCDSTNSIGMSVDTGIIITTLCSSSLNVGETALPGNLLSTFPNPVNQTWNIDNSTGGEITVFITDIMGRNLVHTKTSSTVIKIDMGNYSNGIYLYRISNKEEILLQGKLSKQ